MNGDTRKDLRDGALAGLAVLVALLLGAGAQFAPPVRQAPVLVIAPPWSIGADAMITAAGGVPVAPWRAPFGSLARFDDAPPVDRLRALGAWAVRDAGILAGLCASGPGVPSPGGTSGLPESDRQAHAATVPAAATARGPPVHPCAGVVCPGAPSAS